MVEGHKIFYIFSCVHFDSQESLLGPSFHSSTSSSSTTAHTSTALIDFIIIPRLGVYGRQRGSNQKQPVIVDGKELWSVIRILMACSV